MNSVEQVGRPVFTVDISWFNKLSDIIRTVENDNTLSVRDIADRIIDSGFLYEIFEAGRQEVIARIKLNAEAEISTRLSNISTINNELSRM